MTSAPHTSQQPAGRWSFCPPCFLVRLQRGRSRRRRGAVALEFVLGVVILTGMTLAVVEYGILMLCRHTVAQAATLAAREAAKKSSAAAANTAALTTVNQVLGIHQLSVVDGSPSSDLAVIVEYGGSAAITTGDPDVKALAVVPTPAIDSTDVRVTIYVDMTAGPMINALSYLGASYNYAGKVFKVTALVQKE